MRRNINADRGSGDALVLRSEMGRGYSLGKFLLSPRRVYGTFAGQKRVRNVLFIIAFCHVCPYPSRGAR
jgi:hypothetical protein